MQYIRQSDSWARYLEHLKWQTKRMDSKILVAYRKLFLGSVAKIQRPDSLSLNALKDIESFLKSINALFLKIEVVSQEDLSLLKKNGYEDASMFLAPPSTLKIDLSKSEEDLWTDLSGSCKEKIENSEKNNSYCTFYSYPDDEVLKKYHEIYSKTGRRKKFYVEPFSDLQAKRNAFKEQSLIGFSFNKDDLATGAKFFLGNTPIALYSTGGTTEVGLKDSSGYLLLWKSFLYLKQKGFRVLDLGGVDDDRFYFLTKDWQGFSFFKERFGGETIRYPVTQIKYFSKFLKFLTKIQPIKL